MEHHGIAILREIVTEFFDCEIGAIPVELSSQKLLLVTDDFSQSVFFQIEGSINQELSFMQKTIFIARWVDTCSKQGLLVCFSLYAIPDSYMLPIGAAVIKRCRDGKSPRPLW